MGRQQREWRKPRVDVIMCGEAMRAAVTIVDDVCGVQKNILETARGVSGLVSSWLGLLSTSILDALFSALFSTLSCPLRVHETPFCSHLIDVIWVESASHLVS